MTGKAKTDKKRKNGQLTALGDLLSKYEKPEKNKYVSREFQDFGYRLAMELGDEKHKALYFKLAKTVDRILLEKALSFVKDAGARSPARLFMWKLKQLRENETNISN